MPGHLHDNEIDEWRQKGFATSGFSWFVRLALISGHDYFPKDCADILDRGFKLCQSGKKQYQKKELMNECIKLLNCNGELIDPDDSKFWFEIIDMDIVEAENLGDWIKNNLMCVPDCWRWVGRENIIQVVEVSNSSRMSWPRIVKYGLLDDILCYYTKKTIRLDVFEQSLNEASFVRHDPVLPFECWYDASHALGENVFQQKESDLYTRYMMKIVKPNYAGYGPLRVDDVFSLSYLNVC